jgi:hypothetical protein
MPKDVTDDRLIDRHMQLLRPEVLAANTRVVAMPVDARRGDTDPLRTATTVGELPDELTDWVTAAQQDDEY